MEKSYAQHYAMLEGEHWWFRARRLILRDLLMRLEWPPRPKILEIGVGPGYNLLEIYPPWGQQDRVNQHHRRYTLRELKCKLQAANFSIERITYFNTFLFPPIAMVRLIARYCRQPHRAEGDLAYVRQPSNAALFAVFGAERFLLRYLDFPFGVSVFATARKR